MKTLLAAIVVPVALLLAAPAHADVAAYQQWLTNHQINIGTYALNPSAIPSLGMELCGRLRAGDSFENTAAYASAAWLDGPGVTRGAQETICPDTLG